jgi:hypothetical protein
LGALAGAGLLARRLGSHDLRAQDRLVEVELAVQLLHDGRLGVQVDDGVDALDLLVDLEREPATAPDVDLLDGPAAVADDVEERLEGGSDGPLLQVGVEDDHELVVTQVTHLLLWTTRPRTFRGRRAFASANLLTLPARRSRPPALRAWPCGPTGRAGEQQPQQQRGDAGEQDRGDGDGQAERRELRAPGQRSRDRRPRATAAARARRRRGQEPAGGRAAVGEATRSAPPATDRPGERRVLRDR